MRTISVFDYLGGNLLSRPLARELKKQIMEGSLDSQITLDFSGVVFATRSFMDEFLNTFLKADDMKVEIINISDSIQSTLDAVSKTQNKKKDIKPESVSRPSDLNEVNKCFMALSL